MLKIGSLFSGIGAFEFGIMQAIPNSKVLFQVEKDPFCRKVLKKNFPYSEIFNDITTIKEGDLDQCDLLLAGFPCQDLSICNSKGGGIHGKSSGLVWEMFRIINCFLRPRVIVLENVPAIVNRGLSEVVGSLSKIGYDCQWRIVSCREFNLPQRRKRFFCIAYLNDDRFGSNIKIQAGGAIDHLLSDREGSYWKRRIAESRIPRRVHGSSNRLDKLRSLGNCVHPIQAAYIGNCIIQSGLIDDLI